MNQYDAASVTVQCEVRRRGAGYDVVGISFIITNPGKVQEMCRMVRELPPDSAIVVGGHVAAIPGIEHPVDANWASG